MGTFAASLKTIGDTRGLPATVELHEGKISIAAGETTIGEWPLGDITLEPIPTGYRVSAEGDQIILEPKDLSGFNAALQESTSKKKRALRRPKSAKSRSERPNKEKTRDRPAEQTVAKSPTPAARQPVALPPKPVAPTVEKGPNGFLTRVDSILDAAHKRWGALLPGWVFARGTLLAGVVLLAIIILFPGPASFIAIVGGLLLIVFGGVAYSDEVVAARWMPGRSTPAHLLIAGIAVVGVGVLIGVIDRI